MSLNPLVTDVRVVLLLEMLLGLASQPKKEYIVRGYAPAKTEGTPVPNTRTPNDHVPNTSLNTHIPNTYTMNTSTPDNTTPQTQGIQGFFYTEGLSSKIYNTTIS